MSDYPKQVQLFHDGLRRFRAVSELDTELTSLASIKAEDLRLPGPFADMPHALLRRTNGGLPDEAWSHTVFTLTADANGWRTLEFLAWWVRDNSRSGEQIQMRPQALPPLAHKVQLGRTLRFSMDHLCILPDGALTPMLDLMGRLGESLECSINLYADVLSDLIR